MSSVIKGLRSAEIRYLRMKIWVRQRGICWICEKPIPRERDPNDPMAMSIDHVIPRADDGDDDPKNLRVAHRLCNEQRGSDVYFKKSTQTSK